MLRLFVKTLWATVLWLVSLNTFNLLSLVEALSLNMDAGVQEKKISPFRTAATERFFVNGSALPDLPFNIPESYAGLLPIDNTGKELFFWFIPSSEPDPRSEITIWLNGGPGCSSLYGFLREQGPVIWPLGNNRPLRNSWSWTNLTNIVWVDQPVGTGFSRGPPNATSSMDAAHQFIGFWRSFMELFKMHDFRIYITGESFAGQYVPYIADLMLQQKDTSLFNVSGILLYDPSFGWPQITKQVPAVAFADLHSASFPFNDTFWNYLHNLSHSCGYDSFLETGLRFPAKGPLNPAPGTGLNDNVLDECNAYEKINDAAKVLNPCFDIYNIGRVCPTPADVLTADSPWNEPYFNRTAVKKALHVPLTAHWKMCTDVPVIANFSDKSPPSALTAGPLQRVIEKTNNVIVAHGTLDMILMLNGTLLTLQNMTWNGHQGFTTGPNNPFYVASDPMATIPSGSGTLGHWVSERGLTFSTVELSGHEVPAYQPAAAFRHLQLLLGRIPNLTEEPTFTTSQSPSWSRNELLAADCG